MAILVPDVLVLIDPIGREADPLMLDAVGV
jgi:hypothetical protein